MTGCGWGVAILVQKSNTLQGLGPFQRTRRHLFGALIVLAFCLLLFSQSVFAPGTVVHEALEMGGVLLIVLGIVGRLWSTLYIGGRKTETIVADGPYSITRNPLYLFSTVAAAGVGAQTGSVVVMLCFAVLCAAAFQIVIIREESYLRGRFGAEYEAYIAGVPRFFPDFSLYREGKAEGFKPDRLAITLGDGLMFLLALPATEIIDLAQNQGLLPVLLRIP